MSRVSFDEATHIYRLDEQTILPSVTEIIKPISNRLFSGRFSTAIEYARNRGAEVHRVLEECDYDLEPDIYAELIPYVQAYLDWKSVYRPTYTDIERIVFDEELGYAGTLDRAGHLNSEKVLSIIDIKTSQATRESMCSVCAQTAAYAIAYPEQTEIKRWVLFLKKDGTWSFRDCAEYEAKNGFDGYDLFLKLLETHRMIDKLLERRKK